MALQKPLPRETEICILRGFGPGHGPQRPNLTNPFQTKTKQNISPLRPYETPILCPNVFCSTFFSNDHVTRPCNTLHSQTNHHTSIDHTVFIIVMVRIITRLSRTPFSGGCASSRSCCLPSSINNRIDF